MSPRFSIIVPIYNAEQYLPDCLRGIQAQTCPDFEVNLVDDGSSDGSLRVLDNYIADDVRFHIYHLEHRGVSSARNVGLKYATGDFICFVDADDQIAPTYLVDLYQAMGEADSSMCGFRKSDSLSHEDCTIVPLNKIETLEENLSGFYAAGSTDWQRYLWNRMFKRSVIQKNNLRFREDIHYKEDGLFVIQYLCTSNGLVGCVDKVLYYYKRNTSGAMSKTWHVFEDKIITNLLAHRLMIEEIKMKNISGAVIKQAISQVKAADAWILQLMWHSGSFSLGRLFRIEKNMFSVLGGWSYFSWRVAQFIKLFR
jgi:glycosyltransferase involved in cell wall biosynthesis